MLRYTGERPSGCFSFWRARIKALESNPKESQDDGGLGATVRLRTSMIDAPRAGKLGGNELLGGNFSLEGLNVLEEQPKEETAEFAEKSPVFNLLSK